MSQTLGFLSDHLRLLSGVQQHILGNAHHLGHVLREGSLRDAISQLVRELKPVLLDFVGHRLVSDLFAGGELVSHDRVVGAEQGQGSYVLDQSSQSTNSD